MDQVEPSPAAPNPPRPEDRAPAHEPISWPRAAALAAIGAGCGASALAQGYYDLTVWGPIAIGLMAVLLGLVLGAPARPSGWALAALLSLTGFWLWAWLSTD